MKSKKLEHLRRCNNDLGRNSWDIYREFLRTLCVANRSDESSYLLGLIDQGDWAAIIDYADSLSSEDHSTATKHRWCSQLSNLIRKYPFPASVVQLDPEKAALETFLRSERKCARVNRRFKLFDSLRSPHERSLALARSWISYVLGDVSLPDIYSEAGFGNGASLGVHGNATNSARKILAEKWTVTPGAIHYANSALKQDTHIWETLTGIPNSPYFDTDPCTFNREFMKKIRVVNHNNISFVPKTAKTHRTIAVEPLLNGYVQKGIDNVMRKRLKRVGIDLSDQTLNQGLALFGSLPDESDPYVTIDLSSASDSISIELCRNLLPPEWFDLLNSTRSPTYHLLGMKHTYQKFTSMGNGFCFPLETLIFASFCHVACVESSRPIDFSVYGDDLIIRQSVAPRLLDLLRIGGFTINRKKSCLTGYFRESCGADWFRGEDVRPIILDYAFDSVQSIFKFCNLVRSKYGEISYFSEALDFLESLIPPEIMFMRPYKGNVDTALEVPLDRFLSSRFSRWSRKTQTWSWEELDTVPVSDVRIRNVQGYSVVLMRGALMGVQSSSHFTLRRKTRTKVVRRCYAGGWSLWEPGILFRVSNPSDYWREFSSRSTTGPH